jgi:poly(3-hydroxybutyrate) depolymerase
MAAAGFALSGFSPQPSGLDPRLPSRTATDQALVITVTGLPDTAAANITVIGPAGFSQRVTTSRTLSGLTAGDYTITAATVVFFGFTLVPDSETRMVRVLTDSVTAVHVTYAPARSPQFPLGELPPGFHDRQMRVMGSMYDYQIFVPHGYAPARSWPVILFLHGSGERGNDNQLQMHAGLGPYVRENAATFPAIVVFPQMPAGGPAGTDEIPFTLLDLVATTALDRTLNEVHADSSRIYITGVSLGAIRSWDIIIARPHFFAASVPIAGALCGRCVTGSIDGSGVRGVPFVTTRLATMPIWVFHGAGDPAVSVATDRTLVKALQGAGAPVKYTEYPGDLHDVWGRAYQEPTLWEWLFAQHR